MKIEAFFQRQAKADRPHTTKPPPAADRGKQADQTANDTLPDCDRDVDKVSCMAQLQHCTAACTAQHSLTARH